MKYTLKMSISYMVFCLIFLTACNDVNIIEYDQVNYDEKEIISISFSDFLHGVITPYNFYDFYKAQWLMDMNEVRSHEESDVFEAQGEQALTMKNNLFGIDGFRIYIFQEIEGKTLLVNMSFNPVSFDGTVDTIDTMESKYTIIKNGLTELFGEPDYNIDKIFDEKPSNPFYANAERVLQDRWHVAHNHFSLELVDNGDYGISVMLNCTPFFDTSDIGYDYIDGFAT